MGWISEFRDFLKEYKIVGLAVAFIIGLATTTLVKSLVDNIIMPFINPVVRGDVWQNAILIMGPFKIVWGAFLGAAVNFIVIALVVFLFVRFALKKEEKDLKKEEKNTKKK